MTGRRRALLLVFAILLGACSSSSDDDSTGEVLPIPTTETAGETAGGETADTAPVDIDTSTLDGLEAQWAQRREAVVTRLTDGGFGVNDDGFLIGPGDFNVDLTGCPRTWDNEPVTGSIAIGHVVSMADIGPYTEGAQAYFDHVNATGGIGGLRIDYQVKNDALTPTKTIEAVDDWIGGDTPLAITTYGTPTSQSVFDQLNGRCIPQPFVGSAHPAWGDPRRHPWTTGLQLSYATEVIHWGNWIKRNLAAELPVEAAVLVIDNDYGRAHQAALERWATRNRDVIDELVVVTHSPSSSSVGDEMAEIAATDPDVFMAVTGGSACESVLVDGDAAGLTEATSARFVVAACTDVERYFGASGRAGDGYLAVDGGVKTLGDAGNADDPFLVFIDELLTDAGIEDETGTAALGVGQFAWAYVEALRIAAELDGGLTRANFLLALRSLDLIHPMLLSGVSFSTEGADDAFPIEGSRMLRYSAGAGAWEPETLVVDLNRRTPNCSWNGDSCG